MVKEYFAKNERCANIKRKKGIQINKIKGWFFFAFLLLFIFIIKGAFAAEVLDEVVATVNGDIITRNQLKAEILSLGEGKENYISSKELQKKVLWELIDEYLLKEEAEKQKIKVSRGEIQKALNNIQGKLSQEEFVEQLKKQGATLEELKKRIKRKLLGEKVLRWKVKQLQEEVQIDDSKVKKFFLSLKSYLRGEKKVDEDVVQFYKLYHKKLDEAEKVYLAQIVVNSKQEADKIIQRLKEGEDFSILAVNFSKGPNAKKGGELGWVKLSQLQSSLRVVIEKLKEGQVSNPLKISESQYRIFQVKEKKEILFENWKEKIKDHLSKREIISLLDEWLKKLRENSFIQIVDEDLK